MRTRIENLKGLATLRENNQNCDFLAGNSMDNWTMIDDAFIEIDSGLINNYGSMSSCPKGSSNIQIIDGTGRFILPAFIDSHTHLVYANDRSEEFNMRMHGSTYTEIATLGGGILNSSKQIMSSNENQLLDSLLERIEKSKKTGTAALEIKSGYGLTADSERKMLRVIKRAKDQVSQKIWSTFLGAHALPLSYKGNHDAYIEEICNEMLPKFADEGLVDFVDIFCETNYFSPKHIDALCNAANKFNLPLKAHVNQFSSIGGLQAAIKNQAWSVDHLEFMTDQDHQDTLELMEYVKYDFGFMFAYSERPGTLAARKIKNDIPETIKKKRLSEIIQKQQNHSRFRTEKFVGKTVCVLIEKTSKRSEDYWSGRTTQNTVAVFHKKNYQIGDFVDVKITSCTSTTLIGDAVQLSNHI